MDEKKRLHEVVERDGVTHHAWVFFCPGCDCPHLYDKRWTFNGNHQSPSFQPSLLCRSSRGEIKEYVCHLFVTDGKIQYLADCTHALAGQTIDLPEFHW